MCMGLPSPRRTYPGLTGTLDKFLKQKIGKKNLFPREPLFAQDVEHLIDVCGIESPQSLQSEYTELFHECRVN